MKPALILLALASALFAAEKPNVILFVTDDQSPIAGCYGSPLIQTPHLDQLAAEGTVFTHAFATTASCSASRSVILTGIHNHANGQYGHVHDFHGFESWTNCASVSLPLQMAANGYRTAHIGKLHVAPESVFHFEEYLPGGGHNTPKWAENCKPLFEAESDKPFFLCFWTSDPHRSGGVQKASELEHKPNPFGNPPIGESYPGTEEVIYDPAEVPVPEFLPDTPTAREEIAQYYQSVTRTDKGLGRLIELLKETGQYENTMIIFTADHGMAFPGAKTTVYEAGLRVPFVVRLPGRKGGVVSDAMLSHLDITPTILDAAGGYDPEKGGPKKLLPVPKPGKGENPGRQKFSTYQGRTWLPLLGTEKSEGWDSVGASHTFHEIQMYYPMRALRDRRMKLIWNIAAPLPYPFASDLWIASTWQAQFQQGPDANYGNRSVESYIQRPEFELYDIEKDPAESTNLADNPEYAAELASMKERLKQMQKQTNDPWILKWSYE